MRCILIILDGLGDRGYSGFQGRTPLEVASTPCLDRIASLGMNGLYHALEQGVPLPSEIAHFLMFGYGLKEFPGRGILEAMGEGIEVGAGDVVFLARLVSVTMSGGLAILTSESPRIQQKTLEILAGSIGYFESEGLQGELILTKGVQGLFRIKGGASHAVTDSNPILEGRPLMEISPLEGARHDPDALRTARFLNDYHRWAMERLSRHPVNRKIGVEGHPLVNAVALQRPGSSCALKPFSERWGLGGLSISSSPVFWGLSRLLKMDFVKVSDGPDPCQDLEDRIERAYRARGYDFIHVHTKVVDAAAHTKVPARKKDVIERLDRAFEGLLKYFIHDKEVLWVITSDHSTPSSGSMIHSGETVPVAILGRHVRRDRVDAFNEVDCAQGALGMVKGRELMQLILNFLDRAKLKGLMDAPWDQPYSPGPYTPLKTG